MQCPSCGSDHTQRLEVAFQNGTRVVETKTKHYSRGAIEWASLASIGKTTGTTISTLAMKAAPPPKKRYKSLLIGFAIGFFVIPVSAQALLPNYLSWIGDVFALIWIIGFLFFVFQAVKFNWKVWPELYREWLQTWHCNKCGTVYLDDVH